MTNPIFAALSPSPTLHINEIVNERWQKGERVLHMGFGESRFAVHPLLKTALVENSHQKSYLPARGLPALCAAVATYYSSQLDLTIAREQVVVGPGSKALIYAIQMALNADIFLPTPSWVSYQPQAELLGLNAYYVPADAKDNYTLNLEALDELVSKSTSKRKLLVLNSPNNPTGQMLGEQALQDIANYCRRHDIIVISDEIYFKVVHAEQEHISIAQYYPEGTCILGGLSKHLSLGGWRLGVAVLPDNTLGREVGDILAVIASETWSSVAAPIQYAALAAYQENEQLERYIDNCAQIHGVRSRYIAEQLSLLGVRCTPPQGAFYVTATFDSFAESLHKLGVHDSGQLAEYLLQHYGIATLAGSAFGVPEGEFALRLSTSYLDFERDTDSDRLLALYDTVISDEEFMSARHHPNTHAAISQFKQFLQALKFSKSLS